MTRRLIAEFLGTFVIVLAPCLFGAVDTWGKSGIMGAALVSGLSVTAMVYAWGNLSGAHFNPGVTLSFVLLGKFPAKEAIPYIGAQFLGGIAAGGLVAALFGPGYGIHMPVDGIIGRALVIETILGAFLMLAILGALTQHKAVPAAAIGLAVICGVLIGGPYSGASMNAARSLGPGLFHAPALPYVWIYLVAPTFGALAAAYMWRGLGSAGVE